MIGNYSSVAFYILNALKLTANYYLVISSGITNSMLNRCELWSLLNLMCL